MNRYERLKFIKEFSKLSDKDIDILKNPSESFTISQAEKMIENAISIITLPMGIATNFVINGKEYLIPMVIEEPSVIAAASHGAKISKLKGGFKSIMKENFMIGQIQLVSYNRDLIENIYKNKKRILEIANLKSRTVKCVDLQIREIEDKSLNKMGKMLIVEILVDTKDAMGANIINTMCESISTTLEDITKGKAILKILSNYATKKIVKCMGYFSKDELGEDLINRILYAYSFAFSDTFRAVTHNKGIMNGIDSVALATGQDFRALEASIHAYAARDGVYRSLSKWYKNADDDLVGELELPISIGTVGGVINVNPIYQVALNILQTNSSKDLSEIMCAVGLAQNFSAIRALASDGIQKGHMKLHAKNIAVAAGAKDIQIEIIAKRIYEENRINIERAKELLDELTKK